VRAEGEHGEGDEWLVAVEPERDPGEQPDHGVGRFDQALRQAMLEGCVDGSVMGGDLAVQVDERREP
jgi:hypothetical protein